MTPVIQARLTTIRDMVKRARNLNQQAIAYRAGGNSEWYAMSKRRSREFMAVARTLASIAL